MDEPDRARRRNRRRKHDDDRNRTPDGAGAHLNPLFHCQFEDLSLRLYPRRQGAALAPRRLVRHLDRRVVGDEQGHRRFRTAGALTEGEMHRTWRGFLVSTALLLSSIARASADDGAVIDRWY